MHHRTNLPSRYVRYLSISSLDRPRKLVINEHTCHSSNAEFAASRCVQRLVKAQVQSWRKKLCSLGSVQVNQALTVATQCRMHCSFSKRCKISKSTEYHWKVIHKNPRGEFSAGRGRPTVIGKVAESEIIATLKQRTQERDALPVSAAYKLINKVVNDTKTRQGKRGADASSERSRNTRKKILKTLDIRMLAPQILTDARKKACECIRISYIWGCLLLVYSGNLSAENK